MSTASTLTEPVEVYVLVRGYSGEGREEILRVYEDPEAANEVMSIVSGDSGMTYRVVKATLIKAEKEF